MQIRFDYISHTFLLLLKGNVLFTKLHAMITFNDVGLLHNGAEIYLFIFNSNVIS